MAGNYASVGKGYTISYSIEVSDKYSKQFENFSKSMQDVEKTAERVSKTVENKFSFKNIGSRISDFGKNLSLYVSAPLSAFAGLSLKAAADVEYLGSSLENFTGSSEKAAKILNELDALSHKSIFNINEYGEAAKLLLSVGTNIDDVSKKVKGLADVSAKFNIPLNSLAQQVATSKEFGFSLRQAKMLAMHGVPVFKELSKYIQKMTGNKYSTEQIKKFLNEGRISGKALEGVLKQMSSEGGLAFNAMDKQTQNLTGSFLHLKNSTHNFMITFGDVVDKTLNVRENVLKLSKAIQFGTKAFSDWTKNHPIAAKNIAFLGAALVTIPPVLASLAIGIKALNFLMLTNPIVLGITAIATAIGLVVTNWKELKEGFNSFQNAQVVGGLVGKAFGKKDTETYNPIFGPVGVEKSTMNSVNSSAEVKINLNDPGKMVRSVETKADNLNGFNLGVNHAAMAY